MAVIIMRNIFQIPKPCIKRTIAMTRPSRLIKPVKFPQRQNYFEDDDVFQNTKNIQTPLKKTTKSTAIEVKCNFEDYYKILGIKDNSTIEEIKCAYYILAKKFHPDHVGYNNSTGEFQKLVEAYNVLSDSTKKDRYDQLRLKTPSDCVKILPSTSFRFRDQTKKLKQLLDKSCNPVKDATVELAAKYNQGVINVNITFLESVQGTTKEIYVKSFSNCPKCNQSYDRRSLGLCTKCNGLGSYVVQTKTYKCNKECDLCYGRCYLALCKCSHCSNRGFLLKESKVKVNIKPGVNNNEIIKVAHPDDPKLQIQAKVFVQENDHFKRKENNIYTEKKISVSEAVLGGSFKVRGIYGDLDLEIEPGTESYSQIKIPGKGVKTLSSHGDHYVTIKVEVPKNLSKEQRFLFQELAKCEKYKIKL